jgi:macrodomain Ter protein organizer (MatP/YcbG family)
LKLLEEGGDRLNSKEVKKHHKSVRVNRETWEKALGKARSRGMTMEELIDKLLKLYNANKVNVKGER